MVPEPLSPALENIREKAIGTTVALSIPTS